MWPNPQEPAADLVTFTKKIIDRNFHFFVQWDDDGGDDDFRI